MCLLCTLAAGVVLACLRILLAHGFGNVRLAGCQAQFGQVHAIGTHVGNHTAFIQALCYHHGLRHAQSQAMCRLLLQGGGGKGRRRSSFCRFLRHLLYGVCGSLAKFQEGNCLFLGLETARQFCLHLLALLCLEQGGNTVRCFALEGHHLSLALHYQAHCHTLHTACRQGWLHLAPQNGAQLEAHNAVQQTACLLCIHQVLVYLPWVLYGLQYGILRNLVEHYALCACRVQFQHLLQMPRDGFSLAVLIGSQPYGFRFCRHFLQCLYYPLLVGRYFILRSKGAGVYAEVLLLQITDVPIGGLYLIFLAKKLFYSLCLGRALHNYKILVHYTVIFTMLSAKISYFSHKYLI